MIAFLFTESPYEERQEAFLSAVADFDVSGAFRSRMFYGTLLLTELTRQLVGGTRRPDLVRYIYHANIGAYKTLVVGLSNALCAQSSSLDGNLLLADLLHDKVYCLALSTCPTELAIHVDGSLRAVLATYRGYVAIDLGSPLQYRLFVDMLSNGRQIDGRKLLEAWPEPLELPDNFPPYERVAVLEGDFEEIADRNPVPLPTTPAGATLLDRFREANQRADSDLLPRVVRAAFEGGQDFEIDAEHPVQGTRGLSPDALRAKLTTYVLNLDHEVGRNKARVFAHALGITRDEWLYLAAQIGRAAERGRIHGVTQTKFGVRFTMDVDLIGLNGARATIVTGWVLDGSDVRLTTAYVANRSATVDTAIPSSYRVGGETAEERFSAIVALAHAHGVQAAQRLTPTPMLIEVNGQTHAIVEVGNAWIHLRDARGGFARWLVRSGKGYRRYGGGVSVSSPIADQSMEKAEAYARAYAEVLRENGIECQVASAPD